MLGEGFTPIGHDKIRCQGLCLAKLFFGILEHMQVHVSDGVEEMLLCRARLRGGEDQVPVLVNLGGNGNTEGEQKHGQKRFRVLWHNQLRTLDIINCGCNIIDQIHG